MNHTLVLDDKELTVLGEMLRSELVDSRIELRHTDDHDFRIQVQRRMDTEQSIADKIEILLSSSTEGA